MADGAGVVSVGLAWGGRRMDYRVSEGFVLRAVAVGAAIGLIAGLIVVSVLWGLWA